MIDGNAANYGAGVFNTGTLTLHQSSLSGNSADHSGGGIYSSDTLTLNHSTLSGNSADLGGGIINFSALTVNQSTFSGNSATSDGGGVHNNGILTVNQSTFFANSANEGGGIANLNTMTINQSTLTANSSATRGGGIENVGPFVLNNSIIAANTAVFYPDLSDASESIELEGFNLFSDTTGSGLGAGPTVIVTAPLLSPLGDYGGPTQTMPPLPGSPVINAAGTTDPGGTDQRGLPRFVGGALDIGAVESQGTSDLAAFWNTDWDGDGRPFGIERALGNDPLTAGPNEEGNLTTPQFNPSGHATLSFRIGDAARADTIWILQRSPDLSPGSWQEIYRYDGPAFEETTQQDIAAFWTTTITPNTTFAHVTDQSPPPGKGFYRFVAELAAP
jgi:predicted outer membrane repeat protein